MSQYKQIKDAHWLDTPAGTIWFEYGFDRYIQPIDPSLMTTPFGVDLDLLDEEELNIFEPIK